LHRPDGTIDPKRSPTIFSASGSRVSSCPQSWTRGVGDDDISLLAFARIAPLFTARIAGACGMPLGLATLVTLLACATRRMMHDRAMLLLGFAIAQA
jgi:hypothetical protein